MRLSDHARSMLILVGAALVLAPGSATVVAQAGSDACPPPPATSAASPAVGSSPTVGGSPAAGRVPEQGVRVGETDALIWRVGEYGVVLAHGAAYDAASWRPEAEAIAAAGTTVLALEQTSPEDILAGIQFLNDACAIADVALIGASAGASSALAAATEAPAAIDQLILLSGTGDVSSLGEQPKLFVASEGEGLADATRRMAEEAPGAENEALILPGDAHAQAIFESEQGEDLLRAILDRLADH